MLSQAELLTTRSARKAPGKRRGRQPAPPLTRRSGLAGRGRSELQKMPGPRAVGGGAIEDLVPNTRLPSETTASCKDPAGITTTLKTYMPWAVTDSAGFNTRYVVANSVIDPDTSFSTSNFQYVPSWAGMYNYYEVLDSEINIVLTNTDDQTKVAVVFPTMFPPGSGNVPTTLDAALHYPDSSAHYVLGNQGGDAAIVNINRKINLKQFMSDKVPSGGMTPYAPAVTGKLPSVANGGIGSSPTITTYWVIQVYPTNDTSSGTDQYDITVNLLDWVKLFGVVLSTALSARSVCDTPLWRKEHPRPKHVPLEQDVGQPAVPIMQKFDYRRYVASIPHTDEADGYKVVYPTLKG